MSPRLQEKVPILHSGLTLRSLSRSCYRLLEDGIYGLNYYPRLNEERTQKALSPEPDCVYVLKLSESVV